MYQFDYRSAAPASKMDAHLEEDARGVPETNVAASYNDFQHIDNGDVL